MSCLLLDPPTQKKRRQPYAQCAISWRYCGRKLYIFVNFWHFVIAGRPCVTASEQNEQDSQHRRLSSGVLVDEIFCVVVKKSHQNKFGSLKLRNYNLLAKLRRCLNSEGGGSNSLGPVFLLSNTKLNCNCKTQRFTDKKLRSPPSTNHIFSESICTTSCRWIGFSSGPPGQNIEVGICWSDRKKWHPLVYKLSINLKIWKCYWPTR